MFREMRRRERELTREEVERLLVEQDYGVLCVSGDDGYPYGVPVNYGYTGGRIYIHSTARESHKLDGIRRSDKVSFCVVARHDLVKEEFSTNYASVIVFGRARLITEPEDMLPALDGMMAGLAPELAERAREHCRHSMRAMAMIEITPEHITGKARRKPGAASHHGI